MLSDDASTASVLAPRCVRLYGRVSVKATLRVCRSPKKKDGLASDRIPPSHPTSIVSRPASTQLGSNARAATASGGDYADSSSCFSRMKCIRAHSSCVGGQTRHAHPTRAPTSARNGQSPRRWRSKTADALLGIAVTYEGHRRAVVCGTICIVSDMLLKLQKKKPFFFRERIKGGV